MQVGRVAQSCSGEISLSIHHFFSHREDTPMRRVFGSSLAVAAVILIPSASLFAQGETSKGVAGGGITAAGWTGQVDANEAKNGMTVNSAKLAKEGDGLHVTTGPAIEYWNPANKARGN